IYFLTRPHAESADNPDQVAQAQPADKKPANEDSEPDPKNPLVAAGNGEGGPELPPVREGDQPGDAGGGTQALLLGRWKCQELGGMIYEFRKDGTVIVSAGTGKGPSRQGKYQVINDRTLEISGLTGQSGRLVMNLTPDDLELVVTPGKNPIQVTGPG